MNVVNDLSFLSLITGATIPVQLVMIILLAASGFSWWYIFIKISVLKNAELAVDEFENTFWTSGDLNKLHDSIHSGRIKNQGLATIFEAGYKEFNRHKTSRADMSDVIEGVRRAMRATYNRELDFLDAHLPFLASVELVFLSNEFLCTFIDLLDILHLPPLWSRGSSASFSRWSFRNFWLFCFLCSYYFQRLV